MVHQIRKLQPATIRLLQLGALLGDSFTLNSLSNVYSKSSLEIEHDLQEAIREGLIIPVKYGWKFLHGNVQFVEKKNRFSQSNK
jgi:predicted ATPase